MKRLIAGIFGVFCYSVVVAQIPQTMSFQGSLTDPSTGAPKSGTYDIIFSLFDDASAGNQAWSETHNSVEVNNGIFSVLLGSQGSDLGGIIFNTPYWIEIQVGDEILSPRVELSSTPYSLSSGSLYNQGPIILHPDVDISGDDEVQIMNSQGEVVIRFQDNYMELGANVSGKEGNAGKIGYNAFSTESLEIVGAGDVGAGRKITFFSEGGAELHGNLRINAINQVIISANQAGSLDPIMYLQQLDGASDNFLQFNVPSSDFLVGLDLQAQRSSLYLRC